MGNPLYDAIVAGRAAGDGRLLRTPDGTQVSDAQFLALATAFAGTLQGAGVAPGDRVAVQVGKSWQALALYVGVLRAGGVFLPLNTGYTLTELDYFIGDAQPRVVVCDPDAREGIAALLDGRAFSCDCFTLDAQGNGTLATRAAERSNAEQPAVVSREPSDLAAILYTSGTTGRSKGAMLTQHNLLSNALTLVEAWAFSADDVLLHALPIFHTHGLFVAGHTGLMSGARLLFQSAFDPDTIIASLPEATVLMGVPTFYTRLLADERFTREAAAPLRLFVSGSAPLLAATHTEFEARTGQRILERYGMTETNMNCSNPYEGERRAGTVGPPLPGVEVRLRDAAGEPVDEPGAVGTLQVRGANVFAGYWKMPQKTAEELLEDGFFITGDLATIDADGYVTIVGRDKDLVISGGYNIYPKEVETVIDALDGVVESAIVGLPHADLGEAIVGFAVVRPGTEADALLGALGERLARYKCPRTLHLIDELPRNTMGKVMKNRLREEALARRDG